MSTGQIGILAAIILYLAAIILDLAAMVYV